MKERIMVAFIEEVQRKGIKFTMDELAENLGVSKRTIYEHYSSKKDILDEIIIKSFHDIEEKEKIILDKQDISTIQKIKEVLIIVPTFLIYMISKSLIK
ncbi:TetR/AcrR family transcriptional regulator [Metabacillus litoralis]|uniref:TetR/AcrR family transcriptional regulator n=1 Tax=Metabacillus litoralis TaxID=152268 RepID=UPI001E602D67|nr:TetR/AcrR family transcriptional regulator [Metabacillus litoralis]UHA62068.1 TetR/AcrR family transcriptional regulator [Metabacillus litoralis]